MKCVVVTLLVLCRLVGFSQNIVLNSSFENNGQKDCSLWYDDCGNEITPLCSGNVNFGCNTVLQGADFFQDAPFNGGQWCIKLKANGSGNSGVIRTYLTGQFLGVFEVKVWMRIHSYGARGDVSVFYKAGEDITGFKGTATYSESWTELTVTDTIKTFSDTIVLGLAATETLAQQGNVAYADMVQFTMKQNWLSVNKITESVVNVYNGEPTIIQFNEAPNSNCHFNLFAANGKPVILNQPMANGQVALWHNTLPAGLYFYTIQHSNTNRARGKIVMQ